MPVHETADATNDSATPGGDAHSRRELTNALKSAAGDIGFDLVGVAPAVTPNGFPSFLEWLDRGYAGEMSYLERRRDAYEHPRHVLEVVRSVVMLGMNYHAGDDASAGRTGISAPPLVDPTWIDASTSPDREGGDDIERDAASNPSLTVGASRKHSRLPAGRVAKYARGVADYHDALRKRLKQLGSWMHDRVPGCRTRGVVDTAPLLERDFARLAGLGWFGKNTMLINKRIGSWTFLAGLLTDVELEPDAPHEASHCGTCTRCLEACPTDAFPEPHVLDGSKCISYLTIELRDQLPPPELREGIGDWLFGCDVCQDVCPWNRKAPTTADPAFDGDVDSAIGSTLDAIELLSLDEATFRKRFRHTPLARPGRAGLLRNACVVLGNSGDRSAVEPLTGALSDAEPLVRAAAAWALGRLGGDAAIMALQDRESVESEIGVREEIVAALASVR